MDVSRGPAGALSTAEQELFEGGPPAHFRRALGLTKEKRAQRPHRAMATGLIAWLPLVFLSFVQQALFGGPGPEALLTDVSVHARYLVAIPLLIVAEDVSALRLRAIALRFVTSGVIRESDRPRFEDIMRSTRRLVGSPIAEAVVLAAVPALLLLVVVPMETSAFPAWHVGRGGTGRFSLEGWWHVLVSAPILLVLILGWLWRVVLWTRLLFLIARLDLRVITSHPDGAGGLGFVGTSIISFSVLAFAFGTIVAGNIANKVIFDGVPLLSLRDSVLGVTCVVVALITLPCLVFAPRLLLARRQGMRTYGLLAQDAGRCFEDKWLAEEADPVDASALDAGDFSALTDLYQVVDRTYKMRPVPVQLLSIATLVVATLLPLVPVILVSIPADKIMAWLAGVLFKG